MIPYAFVRADQSRYSQPRAAQQDSGNPWVQAINAILTIFAEALRGAALGIEQTVLRAVAQTHRGIRARLDGSRRDDSARLQRRSGEGSDICAAIKAPEEKFESKVRRPSRFSCSRGLCSGAFQREVVSSYCLGIV